MEIMESMETMGFHGFHKPHGIYEIHGILGISGIVVSLEIPVFQIFLVNKVSPYFPEKPGEARRSPETSTFTYT